MVRRSRKNLAQIQQQFRVFYEEKLRGDYAELEEKRRPYLKSFKTRAGIAVLLVCVCTMVIAVSTQVQHFLDENDWLSDVSVFLLTVWAAYVWAPVSDYKKATKQLVMDKILSFWGNLRYCAEENAAHSAQVLKQSCLFSDFNQQTVDDCFEGEYNGVNISVSEQELRHQRYVGDKKHDDRVFKGILISFALPKSFNGQTIVHAKKWGGKLVWLVLAVFLCIVGGAYALGILEKRDAVVFAVAFGIIMLVSAVFVFKLFGWRRQMMQQVELEDVVFGKNWDVETTDQIEARYVLSPAFMERMLEVKKCFKGREIEFSFWDNKLLIAVHTGKDMFETTSLFESALNYRKVREVVTQFYSVFSVVDLLLGQKGTR